MVLTGAGSGLFVTATGPHRRGDALGPLFNLTAQFCDRTLRGARAKAWRDSLGYIGSIRALEITYTENGWHPHVHTLMLFDRVLTPAEVAGFRTFLFGRWEKVLRSAGFGALHPVHGLDVRPVYDTGGLSEYVTAVEGGWGVGLELARADLKHRSRSPMELLGDWAFGGDLEARALWCEYESVTFGRRCIQWTPGLRARLLPDVEDVTDEELAQAEGEDEVVITVCVASEEWNLWCRAGEVGEVLRQIEEMSGVLMFLSQVLGDVGEVWRQIEAWLERIVATEGKLNV